MKFNELLGKLHACSDTRAFVGDKTLKQAWESAQRPDWMLWLMERVGYEDDQLYRLYACWCAANTPLGDGRVTWDLLTDNRSRKAILVAIDFANGEATREELAAARDDATAAVANAAVAAAAVANAAVAAAAVAYAAANAAAAAAEADARGAAYWTAYRANARANARASATQAKELRRRVDFKKLERLVKKAAGEAAKGGE